MNTWLQLSVTLWVFSLSRLGTVAYKYEFVFENEELFDKCTDIPGNIGAKAIFDMSNSNIGFNDGIINLAGEMLLVWKTNPTDRIQLRGDLFKFQRGTWQPTLLTLNLPDFCKDQFKSGTIWHTSWTKYIKKEDQLCLNNYQHIYHYDSFDIDTKLSFGHKMEGRHKVRVQMDAFDMYGVKNPESICFEMIGEMVKMN